jgi:hypothetical protein
MAEMETARRGRSEYLGYFILDFMKVTNIIWYSMIFLGLSVFAFSLVFQSMTDRNLIEVPKIYEKSVTDMLVAVGKCSDRAKIEGLEQAKDPHLRKLAEYQAVCDSFVTDRMMVFTDMPKDELVARAAAKKMAETLKEFSYFGVKPLVIVEPVSEWGLIDFEEFGTGFYDEWIRAYFSTLKSEGITNEMMGAWVPFPEANLPYWNHANATPKDFAAIVNKYLSFMKAEFPQAKGSVMLNSATYDNDDFDWANGEYVSLIPYVSGIQRGLVDSFGIQGFSWAPPAGSQRSGIFDAREYLNARLAMEAADALGTKEIWFNTGSFGSKYTLDEEKMITIEPGKRKDILNGILSEVATAQQKGYTVWINLFSEDKSRLAEATDWSYWKDYSDVANPHRSVFIDFVTKAREMNLPLSLFDISREVVDTESLVQ